MGWSGSWFSFWCGASAVGMGPGNESTFQGLKAADTAMPTSGLFCLFQQISHVKSVCFRGRGWGVWGPRETMGVRGWGLLSCAFLGTPRSYLSSRALGSLSWEVSGCCERPAPLGF